MPYNRETAGKGGHADFIRNPDIQNFLSDCNYLREPSDDEAKELASRFTAAPQSNPENLPRYVVASDASKSDTPISDKLPSTQIGFLKVSHVLVDMEKYAILTDPSNRFVDPFKVADMHRSAAPMTFVMPGSNIRYRNINNVRDGFRRALFDQLNIDRSENQSGQVLARMLVALNGETLALSTNPCCGVKPGSTFNKTTLIQLCCCGAEVYVTDFLRLHEGISDFGDNASAMTRMMNAVEHLLLAGFISQVFETYPEALAGIAFVLDGPLGIFGEPAKLSQRLQALIHNVNTQLMKLHLQPMLVLGLQKTGGLMDHALLLKRFLPDGVLRVVDDEYRNKFITGGDSPAANFGNETYYGQDFIFKTESGRIFNFAIPYPFKDKTFGGGGKAFAQAKVQMARYGTLIERACDLIRHFEMDLYDNSLVPVALAHRHASISLVPGGKMLDLLVRSGLGAKKTES
ncbi:hypothetical protein AA303_17790 [Pseudomonas psychrophila]|uniref:hypothetical protein n=1 Tax=Pseudomonas psychrophila TaxID=122355 RepID=UPI00062A3277|nr:hypothetical protein [Pseudomonas psychrophila]KOX63731.1 hypothetical protein AA303_17790 [Pseudomonas psychrophila]